MRPDAHFAISAAEERYFYIAANMLFNIMIDGTYKVGNKPLIYG